VSPQPWEPILATDWRPPGGSTLGRIAEGRARQFWDPEARRVRRSEGSRNQTPPQPKPHCCIQNGFYWDEAILYPAGEHWKDAPASMFWNGPVVRIIPSLEKSLSEVH
jgi:hypothetical protein